MVLGEIHEELKDFPESVLQKIGNWVKYNNQKKDNLKIKSIWYAPGDGESAGNFFYVMTLAKRGLSRRSNRLSNYLRKLEIEVTREDNFNINMVSLPFGNEEDSKIMENYGFEKVFDFIEADL